MTNIPVTKLASDIGRHPIHAGPVLVTVDGYDVIECQACGFRHIDPLLGEEELKQFYNAEFYEKEWPNYFKNAEEDKEWWMLRYHHLYDLLDMHAPGKRLLDIGSGPGYFLEAGRDHGWDVTGFEPSPIAAEYTRERGLKIVNDLFTLPRAREEGRFDVVSLNLVLEHLREPITLIAEIKTILNPGGLLFLTSPNDFNPYQQLLWKHAGFKPWWVVPRHHLNYFNTGSIMKLCRRMDFDVLHVEAGYPMEQFLLSGRNYVGNGPLGRECHRERKAFESHLLRHDKNTAQALYKAWAEAGIGREFVVVARNK
jgi:SAM-dependent methyltransferase